MRKKRKQYYYFSSEEEEVRMRTRWSEQLPQDITQVILQKLCISDYIRCGAVCPSWRSAAIDMAFAPKPCPLAPQLPWLMLTTCDSSSSSSSSSSAIDHHFLSLSEGHKLYKTNPTYDMQRQICVGSIEGWLIMVDNDIFTVDHDHTTFTISNFFLNPISGARVMLPSESTIPSRPSNSWSCLQKVAASSVPTSSRCLVAGHYLTGPLAFCTPSDKSWTLIDADGEVLIRHEEKVAASSVPTSSRCLVAGHYLTGPLAFCTPSDKSWTLIDADGEEEEEENYDIEIIDEKLYVLVMDAPEHIFVFDLHLDPNGGGAQEEEEEYYDIEIIDEKLYVLVMDAPEHIFVFDLHLDPNGGGAHTYTAERLVMLHPWPLLSHPTPVVVDGVIHASKSEVVTLFFRDYTSKELFMTLISKSYSYEDGKEFSLSVNDPHTDGFRLFKLEHDDNGARWIQVTNLGNRILFLSMASSLLVPSAIGLDYYGPCGKTLEKNRIYFVFDGGHDLGVFSFTDGSFDRYTFPFPKDRYSTRLSPIWFTPNFW